MRDAVIRVTSRVYYRGEQERAETYRMRLSDGGQGYWSPDRLVWAVQALSGCLSYTGMLDGAFTAWRPSIAGTDGSPRGLHYIDADPWDVDCKIPYAGPVTVAPDPDWHREVWISRAWLESGFTAAERRQIHAALRRVAAAREWHQHESDDPLAVLQSGIVPGW